MSEQNKSTQPTPLEEYETGRSLIKFRQMVNANLMQENRRLFSLLFLLMVAVAVSIGCMYVVQKRNAPPYYVTTNENNQYVAPTPLHEPLYDDNGMKARALRMLQGLMSYDYFNYIQQINEKRYWFTDDGWESYRKALEDSQTLDMINAYRMIVKFKPTKTPEIIRQGVLKDGSYAWQIEIVGEFMTQRLDPKTNQIEGRRTPAKVNLLLAREGLHKYEDGIAIRQFNLVF